MKKEKKRTTEVCLLHPLHKGVVNRGAEGAKALPPPPDFWLIMLSYGKLKENEALLEFRWIANSVHTNMYNSWIFCFEQATIIATNLDKINAWR